MADWIEEQLTVLLDVGDFTFYNAFHGSFPNTRKAAISYDDQMVLLCPGAHHNHELSTMDTKHPNETMLVGIDLPSQEAQSSDLSV